MDNVTEVDFGKDKRETVRIFARLVGILEEREADILRDPLKYLSEASKKMAEMREVIVRANDALRIDLFSYGPSDAAMHAPETIRVMRDEYDRLRACAAIVRAGL